MFISQSVSVFLRVNLLHLTYSRPEVSPDDLNDIINLLWYHSGLFVKKSPHIPIATKVKLFNTTCVTILLYGCESWVISQDMENNINAFAISCYRVMLNIKRIDHVLKTTVYSMTNTVPLIHLVRHRQLKFLGHILRMSEEEPARKYALYIPTIGKRRPGRRRTSYLTYVQRLLGIMKEQCKNIRLPHLLMIVVYGETLWSPAPQPMDDDDDDDDS